jgi:hypothetical protein
VSAGTHTLAGSEEEDSEAADLAVVGCTEESRIKTTSVCVCSMWADQRMAFVTSEVADAAKKEESDPSKIKECVQETGNVFCVFVFERRVCGLFRCAANT